MTIVRGLMFVLKSIFIAVICSAFLIVLGVLVLTNIDLSFLNKPVEIQYYNNLLSINLPTDCKCVASYSSRAFTDGDSYTVFEINDDVDKYEFVNLGFEKTNDFDEILYDKVIGIHKSENIPYYYMLDSNKEYLIKFCSVDNDDYYLIYDSNDNNLFILRSW